MTGILIRRLCVNTDTQGGCHVTEAKTGVMALQAKTLRGPLDSKRQRNDCPLDLQRKHTAASFWTSNLHNSERVSWKHPSLW